MFDGSTLATGRSGETCGAASAIAKSIGVGRNTDRAGTARFDGCERDGRTPQRWSAPVHPACVIGSPPAPIECTNADDDRCHGPASDRGAVSGARSIEVFDAGLVSIVTSIQHPHADVTAESRGKIGALHPARRVIRVDDDDHRIFLPEQASFGLSGF